MNLYKNVKNNLKLNNIKELYKPENILKLYKDYIKKWLYFKKFNLFYRDEDILKISKIIDKKTDFEYWYTQIVMMSKRYLLNINWIEEELPQTMYLFIALFLAIPEWLDKIKLYLEWKLNIDNNNEIISNKNKFEELKEEDKKIILNNNKTLEDILKINKKILLNE